jgi:hypothetical protein
MKGSNMNPESLHTLMLAAARYASSRSGEDRALMLSVGNEVWKDFPAFLTEMKRAIQSGRSREFLRQEDVKHMYALMLLSIASGLGSDYLDRVGGALSAAAAPDKFRIAGHARSGGRETREFAVDSRLPGAGLFARPNRA